MICFVEFFRNADGLYEAGQTVRTACIRALMKRNGVLSSLYRNQSLSSVNEIADDILLLAEDGVVFIRNANCDAICDAVSAAILADNEIPVYFISEYSGSGDGQADCALDEQIGKIIQETADRSELQMDIHEVSPYREEILAIRDYPDPGSGSVSREKEVRKSFVRK